MLTFLLFLISIALCVWVFYDTWRTKNFSSRDAIGLVAAAIVSIIAVIPILLLSLTDLD